MRPDAHASTATHGTKRPTDAGLIDAYPPAEQAGSRADLTGSLLLKLLDQSLLVFLTVTKFLKARLPHDLARQRLVAVAAKHGRDESRGLGAQKRDQVIPRHAGAIAADPIVDGSRRSLCMRQQFRAR